VPSYTAAVDIKFSKSQRERIGEAIIKFIKRRARSNKGIGGKKFSNYSDRYANSLEFKIAGKSQTDPNVKLTGDMLDTITILNFKKVGEVVIGFRDKDSDNKAEWVTEKGFGFLGLTKKELSEVVSEFNVPNESDTIRAVNG
jgi:hypothetical protein